MSIAIPLVECDADTYSSSSGSESRRSICCIPQDSEGLEGFEKVMFRLENITNEYGSNVGALFATEGGRHRGELFESPRSESP